MEYWQSMDNFMRVSIDDGEMTTIECGVVQKLPIKNRDEAFSVMTKFCKCWKRIDKEDYERRDDADYKQENHKEV